METTMWKPPCGTIIYNIYIYKKPGKKKIMKTTNRKKYNSFICDFCVYNGKFEDINVSICFCRKLTPYLDENGTCKDFKEKKSNEEHNQQIELEL